MFDKETLKDLLARGDISNTDKLLICLASDPLQPRTIAEIKESALASGLRAVSKWNISTYLARTKSLAARTTDGWELTSSGRKHVATIAGPFLPSVSSLVVSALRNQLQSIKNEDTRRFVTEAIGCLEAKLHRAAVVMSWVGAVAVLYDAVVSSHLAAFNAEALRRDPKWKAAKVADDLSRLTEFEFLQILAGISVIGKNVKNELETCLKLRNGSGHPNTLVVGEHKASAHVESLIQNVYAKF